MIYKHGMASLVPTTIGMLQGLFSCCNLDEFSPQKTSNSFMPSYLRVGGILHLETPSCQVERSRNPMEKLCAHQNRSQGENTKVKRQMNLMELIYVNC
jgi:hypothetical protein